MYVHESGFSLGNRGSSGKALLIQFTVLIVHVYCRFVYMYLLILPGG